MSQYHHGNLRAEVLRLAEAEIASGGLEGMGLRELARRCGVSHAALFRHFRNREELIAALALEGFQELTRRLETSTSAQPRLRLEQGLVLYLFFASERLGSYRAMFGGILNTLEPDHPAVTASAASFEWLKNRVDECRGKGLRSDLAADRQALVIWSALHGAATLLSEVKVLPGPPVDGPQEFARWVGEQFLTAK